MINLISEGILNMTFFDLFALIAIQLLLFILIKFDHYHTIESVFIYVVGTAASVAIPEITLMFFMLWVGIGMNPKLTKLTSDHDIEEK